MNDVFPLLFYEFESMMWDIFYIDSMLDNLMRRSIMYFGFTGV